MNKQLIPCLYLQAEKAVTGFGQRNLFGDGNVETLAKFYGDNGADELLVFDFSSADAEHDRAIGKIRDICRSAEIPVIAAGGIADGRGIAAAFMLGAEGVQIGTRFVVTEEAQVHENYKECILKARDIDSRVTGRSTGHPVRALRNKMTKEYLEKEQAGATFEELEHLTLGGLRRAVVDGDVQSGSVMAGQIAGMIKEKLTCQEVIQKLVSQTDELIGGKGFYE